MAVDLAKGPAAVLLVRGLGLGVGAEAISAVAAVAGQMCIVPVDCLVLDGFYNFRRSRGQGMPDYVVSPRGCQQYVIE